jgi:dihydroorotate dehydrogenase electron transfer subunit
MGQMITHQQKYKIVVNKKVSEKFYQLSLDAPSLARKALPGQFVHIRINDTLEPFFRRPFSIYRAQKTVDILYDVVGHGTKMLAEKKRNDVVDCLGPLGTSFSLPPKNIKQIVLIAGGVGVAPFLALTDTLKKKHYKLVLLYGAKSKKQIFSMKDFKANGCEVYVSTDDGSVGKKGKVSVLFSKIKLDVPTYVYTCGPKPMMACVQAFVKENHLEGQASLEEVMACGIGACLGCSIKTNKGYKTVCHDGPVFDVNDIIF